MTQIQHCRYCDDFYHIDNDNARYIETDDDWVSDIYRQYHAEVNREEQALDATWEFDFNPLSETDNDEGAER